MNIPGTTQTNANRDLNTLTPPANTNKVSSGAAQLTTPPQGLAESGDGFELTRSNSGGSAALFAQATSGTNSVDTPPANRPPANEAVPADIQADIDKLNLPEGRYNAELRIEGGVTGNEQGDINASGRLTYQDQRIAAMLAGRITVDNNPETGRTQSDFSIGGGIVIGLGAPNRSEDVVNAQNKITQDLGALNDEARGMAQDIGENPELTDRQKERALRDLGNKVAMELTEGLTAVQNSEEGADLPDGLVNQLDLRMNGPFGTNGAFEEINRQLRAVGAEEFPVSSTSEAVQTVAGLVEKAGENTTGRN